MGLDQYITKKTSGQRGKLVALGEEHHFRKFNSLHGWMERNVGDIGNEEDLIVPRSAWKELLALCDRLLPYKSLLVEAMIEDRFSNGRKYLDTVILDPEALRVLKAEMPLTEGCFFGEYDHYKPSFFEDLEDLKKLLTTEILNPGNKDYDDRRVVYTYLAWW